MNTILFRREAEADLRSIVAYYEEVAPEALSNILSDIHRSIDQLARYPIRGCQSPTGHFAASSPSDITSR